MLNIVIVGCIQAMLLVAASLCSAQSLQQLQSTEFVQDAGLRIEPSLSYTWGTSADDFFTDYAEVLGGRSREFSTPIGGSLRISRHLDSQHSLGLSIGYIRSSLRENYDYDPRTVVSPLAPPQNITQNMTTRTIPVMLCYDLYPVDRQFTSYVGVAVGAAFSHLYWYEDLTTSRQPGARSKGVRFDEWLTHPALEIRSGLSLGFDGNINSAARSGIRLECSYRSLPMQGAFMRSVARSFALLPPDRLSNTYTLDMGGFSVHVGLMLVLRHRN